MLPTLHLNRYRIYLLLDDVWQEVLGVYSFDTYVVYEARYHLRPFGEVRKTMRIDRIL